jgi:hypothetical protein
MLLLEVSIYLVVLLLLLQLLCMLVVVGVGAAWAAVLDVGGDNNRRWQPRGAMNRGNNNGRAVHIDQKPKRTSKQC